MNHDLKHSPAVATLRRELADLWRTLRRLRTERRSQPTAQHRIAEAWREGWSEGMQREMQREPQLG